MRDDYRNEVFRRIQIIFPAFIYDANITIRRRVIIRQRAIDFV